MTARIGIIGDGGWGTALAIVLHQSGHEVRVWSAFADYADEVRRQRENRKFLPGVRIPDEIAWTHDRRELADGAEAVVVAVPSKFYADTLRPFRPILPADAPILSVTKGLERGTGRRMSKVAADVLDRPNVATLSGPSHAEEVARNIPTAVVAASTDRSLAEFFQKLFTMPTFRVYSSTDPLGVELGGALKNVIAIAAGACDGLGFGDNTKAALITRGLAEITRLGCAMGAKPETFAGLSGMGDLVVTCMSRHSRNRRVGERLGRGERLDAILADMEQVAEGVWTCQTALELAQRYSVDMPIVRQVHAVLYEGARPADAVQALLARQQKSETL
jgi:glycerol-3-phosphate dehydrogenase (NAD(P)+)